jgi:hypothetical protein
MFFQDFKKSNDVILKKNQNYVFYLIDLSSWPDLIRQSDSIWDMSRFINSDHRYKESYRQRTS